jgi:hypothetical protein
MKIVSVAQHKIIKDIIANQSVYKDLLRKLIVEGLIKLFEEKVVVKYCVIYSRCLKRDEAMVESILLICKR